MSKARSLLARLQRLETGNKSPILRIIGSVEEFEARINAQVAAGQMCPIDGPFLAKCVRKWATGQVHYTGSAGNARG